MAHLSPLPLLSGTPGTSPAAPSPAAPRARPLLVLLPSSGHLVQTCRSFRSADSGDSSNTGGKDGGRG